MESGKINSRLIGFKGSSLARVFGCMDYKQIILRAGIRGLDMLRGDQSFWLHVGFIR